jgi:hypothetical protein
MRESGLIFLDIMREIFYMLPGSGFSGLAGLWYPSSRVQPRPKPSDFSGEKLLGMPSFGGEVKPSVPCRRFSACKISLSGIEKASFRQNYRTQFSSTIPPFATRSACVVWYVEASGGESGNV